MEWLMLSLQRASNSRLSCRLDEGVDAAGEF